MTTYNGWTNRETWLVNLYFGDDLYQTIKEEYYFQGVNTVSELAEVYKNHVMGYLAEELNSLGSFLSDYLDLGRINWDELADSVISDIKEDVEES